MHRQPVEGGMDGEIGLVGLDRIVEQHIQLALVPEDATLAAKGGPFTWAIA